MFLEAKKFDKNGIRPKSVTCWGREREGKIVLVIISTNKISQEAFWSYVISNS